ncbi:hypothetical protein R1T08_23440 [Streptomyces sp. SBC-4]|nr:hypothetical protein [Streptomyces sp. SBC-4]MDV5147061.1 hypothetical protein [Streptomyces sp. SBC-4]
MSPVMSPAKLRMIGLGAAVAVAVLLPIVAVAGPTGLTGDAVRPAGSGDAKSGDGGLLPDLGLGLGSRTAEPAAAGPGPDPASAAPSAPSVPSARSVPSASSTPSTPSVVPAAPERTTKCGPELASPEGIEAQTCVLARVPTHGRVRTTGMRQGRNSTRF